MFRGLTQECARAPNAEQEGRNRTFNAFPERLIVGFEHDPLRAVLDRLLDHVEQTTDVDITPRRIARNRASTPNADSAIAEVTDAVDTFRVEDVLFALRHIVLQAQGTAYEFIGRSFVNTTLGIATSINTSHVARWRLIDIALLRIVNFDPREVVGTEFRIARLGQSVHATFFDRFGAVENGKTIFHVFAVAQKRILNRRIRLTRRAYQRNIIDFFQKFQTGT